MEILGKFLPVITGSMLKFIFGPLTGYSLGLSYWETCLCTIAGMMATVSLLSLIGAPARVAIVRFIVKISPGKQKNFTPNRRRMVRIWKKYGLKGAAFLTPLLLTPPGGTLLAISFGETPQRIIVYMLGSALFWGIIITGIVYLLGTQVLKTYLPV